MLKTSQHKKAIIEALEQSLGVVTTACKKVGISRRSFYDWMANDEDFKKEVEGIQDIALDFVESQLFKNIKEGKSSELIFYLKTKGKKRGYIERSEHEHSFTEITQIKLIDVTEDTDT